ncbi:MAG: hypothetical protein KDK12_13085 [Rhodobacteraceae bacterium]|nr:hypothetical protein [Paracoccaceae bacterium]
MRRLLLALPLLATPALATDPCEDNFRAGLAAYRLVDSRLSDIEVTLYAGLGWVTRRGVLARLEDRSAQTSACQEVAQVRDRLNRVGRDLGEAQRRFQLAATFCIGINRSRAEANVERLSDSASMLDDLENYTRSLAGLCQGS